jgi:two-component system, LytTR family, response regulator LytT
MRVLIIEDDVLWQMKIEIMLSSFMDCQLHTADSIEVAQQYIERFEFDLIFSDIVLPDGLTTDLFAKKIVQCPILFMTSFEEYDHYKNAMNIASAAFLVKPFHELTLRATIDLLQKNHSITQVQQPKTGVSVVGKYGQREILLLNNIYLIQVEGNYSIIYTESQKHVLKISLKKLIDQLDANFIQIHKSTIINSKFIERVDVSNACVHLKGTRVAIGRSFQKSFLQFLSKKD